MLAVYKKELKSYFTSMIGYVIIAFFLVCMGIYYTAYNLAGGYPVFGYVMSGIKFVFLIVAPILTMRLLAEETRQKTDQLLYTAPVSIGKIIAGKYLAVMTVFSVPMLIACLYPLILMQYGTVSLPMAYTSILGFWFLGGTYIALGMFISSLTESQVLAAVATFGIALLTYMMTAITSLISESSKASLIGFTLLLLVACIIVYLMTKNTVVSAAIAVIGEAAMVIAYVVRPAAFESAISKVLGTISFFDRYDNFVSGILDLGVLVYYISFICLFLFLTVQVIQKRRWS
jgi:ABC-2 type transport system permease protein